MSFIRITEINIENFGKLSNVKLSFANGIIVINGNNEAGKSTVGAFIKFMLYGIKGRGNIVSDNEKIKFTPWDGSKISGSMTLECDDGSVYKIVRRGTSASGLVFTDINGFDVKTSLQPGEYFFGVDENTFLKSAFVGQNDISANRFSGLSQMLKSLMLDAQGDAAIDDVRKKLVAERNTLMTTARHSGEIVELEKRKRKLNSDIEKFSGMHKELLESEFLLSECKKAYAINEEKKKEITAQIENLKCIEAKKLLEKLKDFVKNVAHKKELFDDAVLSASWNGFTPDHEYLEQSDAAYYAVCSSKASLLSAEKALISARQELLSHSSGNKKCLELHEILNERNEVLDEKGVGEILDEVVRLNEVATKYDLLSKIFAFLIVTFPLFFVFKGTRNKALNEVKEICKNYYCDDSEQLRVVLSSYNAVIKLNEALSTRLKNAMRDFERAGMSFKSACSRMCEIALQIGHEIVADNENFAIEYRVFRKSVTHKIAYVENAKKEYDDALREKIAFLSVNNVDKLERLSRQIINPTPEKDGETLEKEMLYVVRANELLNEKISELERKAGILTGAVPNPSSLATELETIENEFADKKFKHSAFELAIETLDATCENIRNNCVPLLSEKAGELLEKVMQGKYKGIKIGAYDGEISVMVDEASSADGLFKSAGFLSAGTYDAVCVCIRLAFAQCFMKETPPVVFDDTFTKLDDERLENMMNCLNELSQKRQIFILSCHDRERNILENSAQVIDFSALSE